MRGKMVVFGLGLGALLSLGACDRADRAARDADNAAAHLDSATNRLADAADRLADETDDWGDNASNRIDDSGARIGAHIANANERLARMVGPATGALVTDDWVGHWRGVEGLNLVIEKDRAKGPGHYILHDQYTLDDKGVFHGVAEGDTIRFDRPDGTQVLAATDGQATGLKYLADKRNCLTVKPGEGYCRD
jgi:hypothetical protein